MMRALSTAATFIAVASAEVKADRFLQSRRTSVNSTNSSASVSGFWYSAFSAGGSGASECAPSTPADAPGSDTRSMSAWFDGNAPSDWCTGTDSNAAVSWMSFFDTNGAAVFPHDFGVDGTGWATIMNSFEAGADAFTDKIFTIGGGSTEWSQTEFDYLLTDCSGGNSLKTIIQNAGYTGIMIDFEAMSADMTAASIKSFISSFAADSTMTLSFTAMGTGGGTTASSTLASALSDSSIADGWSYLAVQLYDASSCLYSSTDMGLAKSVWSAVDASKMLLGIPQGVDSSTCCSAFMSSTAGYIEWLYRPVPCTTASGCTV
eukprot:TRINITY_DN308_c0_g1_i5.p1 TRINITY_DN308_c0_g1~~TRINITY_DN308_c0_g1_i5.p1  ORF type:complete len:319 (-),score=62.02 TRINITY_DN308_c0_g1_i5:283-1239(-)